MGVLEMSRERFRCIGADNIRQEDMAQNTPNPERQKLTKAAKLGEPDAFLSHSWHDDAEEKWEMLQEWRESFKKHHKGREPKLWIDKYCIDQSNISESLACLPAFLFGCKKLLILCGKTYLDRLWCLIEIMVFIEMGGEMSNLEVRLLRPK